VVRLEDLSEVFQRRFNQKYTALEVFTKQGRAYFFNLFNELRLNEFKKDLKLAAFSGRLYENLPQSFINSRYLPDWKEGKISNFEYLMALNRFASRSVNDLNQYPVFPWVLSDYESAELPLGQEAAYRDLTKPIGAVDDDARKEAENRYSQFANDPDFHPYHYGSHYSTSGAVVHFLARLEPYTSQAILLQDGQFDVADRLFYSVGRAYLSSLKHSGDYKELVPELFYLPEALSNLNRLPLGRCQEGVPVDSVLLPLWAGNDPHRFVRLQRAALESEKVSEGLNQWIDLIFGWQQTGEPAKSACNVFLDSTYENIAREMLLRAQGDPKMAGLIDQVLLYGQTPVQLLPVKHPKRVIEKETVGSIFQNMRNRANRNSTTQLVTVSEFIGRPIGVFSYRFCVIIVLADKRVGVYKPKQTTEKFKETEYRYPEGVFPDPSRPLNCLACKLLLNSYLVTGLHQDHSFKIHTFDRLRLVTAIVLHIDIVTAISVDSEYILAGSRDTTLSLWKVKVDGEGKVEEVSEAIWRLRGQQSGVRQCALLWGLQVAVSLGENGDVLLHSLRTGFCVRKLFAFLDPPILMDVSKSGLLAFSHSATPRQISIFSLNGLPVKTLPDTPSPLHLLVFSSLTDSLVLGSSQCLQLSSVFDEFRTEAFALAAEGKLEVCGFAPGEQSLLRLVKQCTSRGCTLVAEQVHSATHLVDFLVKHGF